MTARTIAPFCCFMLSFSLYAQPAPPAIGTIRGVVTTSDHNPAAVYVRAARTSPLPAVVAAATADPSGNFQITGLFPGIYELCLTATSGGYIDPCLWEGSGVVVTVSAGSAVQTAVTLKKAATLKVHVIDAGRLIKNSAEGAIVMGVFGPGGHLHRLAVKAPDASGKNYEISVPYDRDLTFSMKPVGLIVADERNNPVADWRQLTLRENSNGAGPKLKVLNFVVIGKKP